MRLDEGNTTTRDSGEREGETLSPVLGEVVLNGIASGRTA
jgi:hypothetical protein